jgi:hypothetical protein
MKEQANKIDSEEFGFADSEAGALDDRDNNYYGG